MLDLGRGRQHDVGVARGVGEELLQHDGEQVVARESRRDRVPVGRHRRRVGVVDHERVDRRVELGSRVRVAEPHHVDGAGGAARSSAGERALCADLAQRVEPLPPSLAPRAERARAGRRGCAGSVRRARGAPCRSAGGSPPAARWPYGRASRSTLLGRRARRSAPSASGDQAASSARRLVEARSVCPRRTSGSSRSVAHDHVHQPERQRGVGARQRLHVPVGRRRGARAQGVDADDACAGRLRLLDDRPQVPVGDERVRPPQHDDAAVAEVVGARPTARRPLSPAAAAVAAQLAARGGSHPGARRAGPTATATARSPGCRRSRRAGSPRRRARRSGLPMRSAMSGERVVPRTGSKSPRPSGRCASAACSSRSGWYTRSRKRLTFGHSSPRVNGWSALPRSRSATPSRDRHLPRAGVGAVVVAHPEHRQHLGHGGTTRAWLWWRRDGTGR